MMMMDQDGMVSSSGEKIAENCNFIHDDDAVVDGSNWYKPDMAAWLAKLEQSEQENPNVDDGCGGGGETGLVNLAMQKDQNGVGIAKAEPRYPTMVVSPNTLMPIVGEQSDPGILKVPQRNAAGMNIPWLKATLSKDRPYSHHWSIKNISEVQNEAECRKWGTKCSCPNANVKIAFRNKSKLVYVRDYNEHNEPSDAVKEVLVDQYMMKITCIIKSYEPKTAELLRHKTYLLGQKHQSWLGRGGYRRNETPPPGVPAKNVTYCTNQRRKRSNSNHYHQVTPPPPPPPARLWSPQSFPPLVQGTRKKGKDV